MKTLVTGVFPLDDHRRAVLEALGLELTFHKDERTPVEHPEEYEAVICNGLFTFQDIAAFENLKFIQLTSAGLDRVPMEYIKARGIEIHNAAGVYSIPMAEYALWGVLALHKQGRFFAENQTARRWEKHRGLLELAGKTVCIVGCGSVGSECAKRFETFGCHVQGIATTARTQAHFDSVRAMDQLPEVLPEADIVVLSLPLTGDTRGLFGADLLGRMKPGAILVNIARGAIVDTAALIDALHHHLSGAVLDVFETEPLGENSPLWEMENVILTPHNSFVGEGNYDRITKMVTTNLNTWRQK